MECRNHDVVLDGTEMDIVNGPKHMGENGGGVEPTKTKPETEAERQFTIEIIIGVVNIEKEQ